MPKEIKFDIPLIKILNCIYFQMGDWISISNIFFINTSMLDKNCSHEISITH